jgi:hypothetical protein
MSLRLRFLSAAQRKKECLSSSTKMVRRQLRTYPKRRRLSRRAAGRASCVCGLGSDDGIGDERGIVVLHVAAEAAQFMQDVWSGEPMARADRITGLF